MSIYDAIAEVLKKNHPEHPHAITLRGFNVVDKVD